jgi:hypothetical protein
MALVTTAAAAGRAFAAAGSFTRLINVLDIGTGHRIAVKCHDRIRQAIAFVGFDPGLEIAAAAQE